MIGTEFFYGQGLGNQLFCYVVSRSIAYDKGAAFATCGHKHFGAPRWNSNGLYFMNVDLGVSLNKTDFKNIYIEKNDRLFMRSNYHDYKYGCDISAYDPQVKNIVDDTLLYGNLQSEKYFIHNKSVIKKWLCVKDEYECYDYSSSDVCVINFRGGDYMKSKELFLDKSYWYNSIKVMKSINRSFRFIVITDDILAAKKFFPDYECYHFELSKDYVVIKNAKYLIVSNSSFSYFPVFTSDTVKFIIAPKYWARHNTSDGYWSSEQNIYRGWNYMDRNGNLSSSTECIVELNSYKKSALFGGYRKSNVYNNEFVEYILRLRKIYDNSIVVNRWLK